MRQPTKDFLYALAFLAVVVTMAFLEMRDL